MEFTILAHDHAGSAGLSSGNTLVIKPSEVASASVLEIARLAETPEFLQE